MKPVVYAPRLNIVLSIMEPDDDEIILALTPAVSAAWVFGVG